MTQWEKLDLWIINLESQQRMSADRYPIKLLADLQRHTFDLVPSQLAHEIRSNGE
jgi:hypothetical protein